MSLNPKPLKKCREFRRVWGLAAYGFGEAQGMRGSGSRDSKFGVESFGLRGLGG